MVNLLQRSDVTLGRLIDLSESQVLTCNIGIVVSCLPTVLLSTGIQPSVWHIVGVR